jgi:shikimate dehydrogenase
MPETLTLGIMGYPLGQTLSPVMHQFLLEKSGLKGSYSAWPTPPEALESTLKQLHQEGVWGLNLTIPHKTCAIPFLEALTPEAKAIGAVNTLTRTTTGWIGHNTDASGFWRGVPNHWKDDLGQDSLEKKQVVILGCGGGARAILSCFQRHPPKALTLICRNTQKGHRLLEEFNLSSAHCLPWETASFEALLPSTHWLIQTTPLGMAGSGDETAMPFDIALFKKARPDLKLSDLVYRPSQTPLLRAAAESGLESQNGLPMLVYQGIEAFERWTGQAVSSDWAQELIQAVLIGEII